MMRAAPRFVGSVPPCSLPASGNRSRHEASSALAAHVPRPPPGNSYFLVVVLRVLLTGQPSVAQCHFCRRLGPLFGWRWARGGRGGGRGQGGGSRGGGYGGSGGALELLNERRQMDDDGRDVVSVHALSQPPLRRGSGGPVAHQGAVAGSKGSGQQREARETGSNVGATAG